MKVSIGRPACVRLLGVLMLTAVLPGVMRAQRPAQGEPIALGSDESGASVAAPATATPRLIRYHGAARNAQGEALSGVVGMTFALYEEQTGGAPLWQETQNVTAVDGSFQALLGAAEAKGIPAELFSGGAPRWLGVLPHAPGVGEQPRVLLVSVPYAMEAANAETLGGLPASAFARAASGEGQAAPQTAPPQAAEQRLKETMRAAIAANGAAPGYLPYFLDSAGNLSSSNFYQTGNFVGVGTATPAFNVDVVSQSDPAAIAVEGFGSVGVNFLGRRARGTQNAPASLQAGDNILTLQGRGYGATGYSPASRAYMKMFAGENWSDAAQGTYISFATTPNGTNPGLNSAAEKMRLTGSGQLGIGTSTPDQMLTVAGGIHSTSGGFVFPDGSTQTTASQSTLQGNGTLTLAAGDSSSTAGNVDLQTAGASASVMSDRMLIAGKAKALTQPGPMANLFSLHLPAGEAAGGRVKFTVVASDGNNYAIETGEIIYVSTPTQLNCNVVLSEYSTMPPTYTNTTMGIPQIGQVGALNVQCMPYTFSGEPGMRIYDTAPTSFTPTTHKVYYTIENQSLATITLQP